MSKYALLFIQGENWVKLEKWNKKLNYFIISIIII